MTTTIGASVLAPSLYIPDLKTRRKPSALQELVGRAHEAGVVRDPQVLQAILLLRERLGATAVGKGVAVPNARSVVVSEPRVVVGRSRRGLDWGAADAEPVHLVLLVLSPAETADDVHVDLVARAAAALRLQRHRQRVLDAESFAAVCDVLSESLP